MIVIPAVDIKNGKCVRLLQGRMDAETVFSDDPSAMARKWADKGAEWIHVVDLDGAVAKQPKNLEAIAGIVAARSAHIQVGGGIRNQATIAALLDMGVSRVILGTEAVRNPQLVQSACQRFPGRIVVGIDAREGRVAIEGWTETTEMTAIDLARRFEDCGVAAIHFTDIQRDGMGTGPNIEQTRRLAESISVPVVASGGVSSIADIQNLLPLESVGVTGVIVGRALYDNSLDLSQALERARGAKP